MVFVEQLSVDEFTNNIRELAELLEACVHDGASIGFVLPFSRGDAEKYWRETTGGALARGNRAIWIARAGDRLEGTVQLNYDTPANQPHRAEIMKLMVHPRMRRAGVARRLMAAAEAHARRLGRRLLTLDTRTGDNAEPLYKSLGYTEVGVIPGYCLDPFSDRLDSTTIMYRELS